MWFFIVLAFVQALLGTGASAHVHAGDSLEATGGYMALPLYRKQTSSSFRKRQSSVPIYTEDLGLPYFINVSIGSNNQTIPLMLDTGSPITWVNADCSKMPDERAREKADCFAQPRYDPFKSNTAKIQNQSFNNTYGTGSVLGPYFTYDIRIGSVVAKSALFGVAAASMDLNGGIFGIGARPEGFPPTVVDTLAAQGQLGSYSYSIDLKSTNQTGALVLGGIDTKKYNNLAKIPSRHFRANLTNIGMTLPNKTNFEFDLAIWRENQTHLPVLFDMGTPTNLLPNDLYFYIGESYPDAIPYMHQQGYSAYKVPCDAPLGTFDYTFGNYTIKVSFQDSLYKDNINGTCTFGFSLGPQGEGRVPYILADAFMRGAYMVFDMDNDEIWMGESADCGSNIVPIGKGRDAVPVIPGCEVEVAPKPTATGYGPLPIPTTHGK